MGLYYISTSDSDGDGIEAESLEDAIEYFLGQMSNYEIDVYRPPRGNRAEIRINLPYGAFVDYVVEEEDDDS